MMREYCDDLYNALKSAVISDTKNTIANENFPVETDDSILGNTLFIRNAHKDLWSIFENEMLITDKANVMLITGPIGVGKS
mmetsp:Transcript_4759/g.4257  ORF Transcript_4759/g.4257 Transcript_4759/m.4257 type:complete len:81 (+) Transcript_4759:19-261(+)